MSVLGWLNWLIDQESRVVEQVERRLRAKPCLALRQISCEWRHGVLTLHGRVRTPSLRRIAEALARRVRAVECVENDIEVVAPPRQATPTRSASGVRGEQARPPRSS